MQSAIRVTKTFPSFLELPSSSGLNFNTYFQPLDEQIFTTKQ